MLSETNTHSFENWGLERYKIDFSTLMSMAWCTTVHGGYDLVKPIDVPENIFIARRVAGLHQTLSETNRHCTRGGGSQRSCGFRKKGFIGVRKVYFKASQSPASDPPSNCFVLCELLQSKSLPPPHPPTAWIDVISKQWQPVLWKTNFETKVVSCDHDMLFFSSSCFANSSQTTVQLTFGQPV